MTIEHKDITDPNLHEPKGVAAAASNRVYVSNGSGSGVWKKPDSNVLQGLSGDGGVSDKLVATDGANGFKLLETPSYGAMKIVSNAGSLALTAVADTTFNTPSQYTLLTGTPAPWTSENLNNITFTTDRLTFTKAGMYMITAYLNIGSFPSSTAKIAIRYRVNGGSFSDLKAIVKSASASHEAQIYGAGLLNVTASDYVQLYIASDTTGNVLIKDANLIAHIVR